MIFASSFEVHPLSFFWLIISWLLMVQVTSALLVPCINRSLIAWNVGLFGISGIYQKRISWFARLLYFALPLLMAACILFWLLERIMPPISGVTYTHSLRIALALAMTGILGFPRFINTITDLRFPLWGEAGILDRVARARAVGNIIYFTARGRAYLQDRFGATPEQFLQIVRRRPTSMATEA
jgi:hypothetical protein